MSTLVIADQTGQVVRRIDLHGLERLTVGRSTQRDVIINDPAISRFHCILYFESGGWCIADAGSRSGTRIDGHPVVWKRLPPGRAAGVGHLLMWIDCGDESSGGVSDCSAGFRSRATNGLTAQADNVQLSFHAGPEPGHDPDDASNRTSVFLTAETDFLVPANRIDLADR